MSIKLLTPGDMEVLEFERTTWAYLGAKEAAIRERFGISPIRYFQRLNPLLNEPAAEVYDPELVRRLRRLRDNRRLKGFRRPIGDQW